MNSIISFGWGWWFYLWIYLITYTYIYMYKHCICDALFLLVWQLMTCCCPQCTTPGPCVTSTAPSPGEDHNWDRKAKKKISLFLAFSSWGLVAYAGYGTAPFHLQRETIYNEMKTKQNLVPEFVRKDLPGEAVTWLREMAFKSCLGFNYNLDPRGVTL